MRTKVTTTNDATPAGVLKKLGLLSTAGEPLEPYTDFMQSPPSGPRALGVRIKQVYKALFETSHEPHKNAEELRTFFNIHSGGGERALDYQVQTFKALCDYADFSGSSEPVSLGSGGASAGPADGPTGTPAQLPPVRIDLHIHLPENKSARDYESIIQDIAKYIYGRGGTDRG
ncbi:MAG TPA: DUF5343 domain-containing protein [Polyangiaceae bacterium]|nr:DUF5343 domain-containing protein [Polyangiaceae bacterium]